MRKVAGFWQSQALGAKPGRRIPAGDGEPSLNVSKGRHPPSRCYLTPIPQAGVFHPTVHKRKLSHGGTTWLVHVPRPVVKCNEFSSFWL